MNGSYHHVSYSLTLNLQNAKHVKQRSTTVKTSVIVYFIGNCYGCGAHMTIFNVGQKSLKYQTFNHNFLFVFVVMRIELLLSIQEGFGNI